MKRDEPKRIAIYVRVSTTNGNGKSERKQQEERSRQQEVNNQLRELREFIARQPGWKLTAEYVDRKTGATANRTQFTRMFRDAAQRKFDLLLFWSLDRFSREGAGKTFQYLERLHSNGVEWWSLKEEYLRSLGPFAEAVLAILAAVAKQERIRISERTKAGMNRAAEEGQRLGRPAVDVDPKRLAALRREGKSLRMIAKELGVALGTVVSRLRDSGATGDHPPKENAS